MMGLINLFIVITVLLIVLIVLLIYLTVDAIRTRLKMKRGGNDAKTNRNR